MLRAQHDDFAALDLLPEWREPVSSGRILRAGVGSLVVHVVLAALFWSLPEPTESSRQGLVTMDLHKAVHLVAPRIIDPTQKDPNKEKVVKPELDIRSALKPAPPKARSFRPPAPAGAASQPAASLPDAPQIQAAVVPPQIEGVAPPLPKSIERPKITFEDVSPAPIPGPRSEHPVIPNPTRSVDDLARAASQPGGGGLPSSTGDSEASSVKTPQLLSDPQGVDFKPYLLQVLAAVRRNWLAVIPQDARMGRRGQTVIQFIIDRHGGVPKVVIATPSGVASFDRAAVAGISASYPFPPLPTGYKGDEIRLQLAFSYNQPSASH